MADWSDNRGTVEGASLQIVTLDELKEQMRVDYEEDDKLILLYGIAAESSVLTACNRTTSELIAENAVRGGEGFPAAVYTAILMFASHLYRNRENVSSYRQFEVPYTLDYLLKPWTKLT